MMRTPVAVGLPRVTVVVVSYRRHEEIVWCLADLAAQETRFPFEVVLVLQGYPAGIPEMLRSVFGEKLAMRVHSTPHGLGVHAARNAALTLARGEVVAFLDDDVRVPPDWVETLVPYYDDGAIGGVGGYVWHPGSERLASRLLRPVLGLSSRRYRIDWGGFHTIPWASHPARDQDADWLSGCNMSFRRTVLQQVGGFDEGYGSYGYDDVDIGLRVRRAGWRLVSSRRLAVAHYPSAVNRQALPDLVREEEARRIRLVKRAIGDRRAWRARYLARFAYHLVGLSIQGIARGCPTLPARAVEGARQGLLVYGKQPSP